MSKKLTTVHEVHDEIQLSRGLESKVKSDDERTVDLPQDVPLSLGLDDQVALGDHSLIEHFHSVDLVP